MRGSGGCFRHRCFVFYNIPGLFLQKQHSVVSFQPSARFIPQLGEGSVRGGRLTRRHLANHRRQRQEGLSTAILCFHRHSRFVPSFLECGSKAAAFPCWYLPHKVRETKPSPLGRGLLIRGGGLSFVFKYFLASFPRFFVFSARLYSLPAGAIPRFLSRRQAASAPLRQIVHDRRTLVGYLNSMFLSSEKCEMRTMVSCCGQA